MLPYLFARWKKQKACFISTSSAPRELEQLLASAAERRHEELSSDEEVEASAPESWRGKVTEGVDMLKNRYWQTKAMLYIMLYV